MVFLALLSFCGASLGIPAIATQTNSHTAHIAHRAVASGGVTARVPQFSLPLERADAPLMATADSMNLASVSQVNEAIPQLAATGHPALVKARRLNSQANQLFERGDIQTALQTWQEAQAQYELAQDMRGVLGSQINQAQALQTMGLYNRAQTLLDDLQGQLQAQVDPEIQALGFQSLGSILQATGYLDKSQTALESSLEIAKSNQLDSSATQVTLGNTLRALQQPQAALAAYRTAAQSSEPLIRLEARLNQLSLHISQEQWHEARELLAPIAQQFQGLPPSRRGVYARVNLASSLMRLWDQRTAQAPARNLLGDSLTPEFSSLAQEGMQKALTKAATQKLMALGGEGMTSLHGIAKQLAIAVDQARTLQDSRAESYALGELGALYEQNHQWDEAAKLTHQALRIAQTTYSPDVAYRWQWQMGRIITASASRRSDGTLAGTQQAEALAAYRDAVTTLRSIRSDLVATNPEIQFSFQESVEPVYRELMSLLLQPDASEDRLTEARDAIEELQLAELENFFRSACLDVTRKDLEEIDQQAAVFYPIILSDRLEVLVAIPGEPVTHHSVALPASEIESTLTNWLQSLSPIASRRNQLKLSQKLYGWLVEPARERLQQHEIKTLVFVPDGPLRNLPMAALHDGQQYLVENYQVALTPGLQLLEPRTLGQEQLQALSVGLTQSRQGFSALPGVQREIEQIQATVPSKVVLDQAFTKENLRTQLQSSRYPIVHLATHGQFSSDPAQTFLLTWDEQINVRDIRSLLKTRVEVGDSPIELLVLSACQTAVGDKQAALGLAGFAVQSGARSTLATLWSVNDDSTAKLMTELYKDLADSQKISRGESLRQAQLALLNSDQYSHPFYWSTFVLVGNWL